MSDDPAPAPIPARTKGFSRHTDCATVVDCGRKGMSRVEIGARLNVPLKRLQAWEARYRSLRAALAQARDLELAWWEKQAREGVSQGTKFNAALWARCMAARFPEQNYGDREGAEGQPPPDARDRAKAVAALLSVLQAGEAEQTPQSTKTKPADRGRGPKVQDPGANP